MNTKIARFGSLLVFCLTLAIALVPPVQARDEDCEENVEGDKICVCDGSNKIKFHDKHSGFKLEVRCRGQIEWVVTLVGDVIVGDDTFLTFTIANEDNTVFDSTISISNDDELVQRELLLKTKHHDRIWVTFEREQRRHRHDKWDRD